MLAQPRRFGSLVARCRRGRLACNVAAVLVPVMLGAAVAWGSECAERFRVTSTSMEPTLTPGMVICSCPRDPSEVRRGDIVLFRGRGSPTDRIWFRRVVALPGESVEVRDGKLFINGDELVEPYVAEPMHYTIAPRELGADQFYILGDNRNASADSHIWGPIFAHEIAGVICYVHEAG